MAVYKFTLNDEYSHKLEQMAKKDGVSVQDCIRNRLFNLTTIYTPVEAVKRAMNKYEKDVCFTLPELYGAEWNIQRGVAGVFGKQFFNYISHECSDKIKYVGMTNYGRHAQYKMM
ncbi:DUF1413 domain-containing protein [Clostridium estertheticum]|uniref:DUF1413 domain-containing protein n=1 Tax=Clostridium estertheticum TaxID=238834 RepID=UPI001C0B6F2A|nr:DUF1413 domain-containing protein [Clostridium estertheticum]MBU3214782.1 DUF1413 domain-containing protein [Clostridium estertheticum]WAG57194.1 DUF1413 domain-containing protein [Clostridium estertheticum]